MKEYAKAFYTSTAWKKTSSLYMSSKNYICERCSGVAVICHHKKYITPQNIHDINITLNPDNLEALCQECHNTEHMSKNNIILFNTSGEIASVKDRAEIKQFKQQQKKIDKLLSMIKS